MILAIIGALIVGGTLGLLGSGGSILTVPILAYVLGHEKDVVIPESLAIVGAIALCAAVPHLRAGRVRWDAYGAFAVGGVLGALLGSRLSLFVKPEVQLLVFGVIMAIASWRMLAPKPTAGDDDRTLHAGRLAAAGLGVGVITGFVGIGGGFMIVPALVLVAHLPMHAAVGTSLLLIATTAASGLVGHMPLTGVSWSTVGVFIAAGAVGGQIGSRAGSKLPQATLKKVFAVSLIPMAGWILVRELMELAA